MTWQKDKVTERPWKAEPNVGGYRIVNESGVVVAVALRKADAKHVVKYVNSGGYPEGQESFQ